METIMFTLKEARDYVRAGFRKGVKCPCCGQLAKLYKRKVDKTMAKTLIWMVRSQQETGQEWYEFAELPESQHKKGGGNYAQLRYWRLLEKGKNQSTLLPDSHSGIWRPTQRGIDFAHNLLVIDKYALVYNNKCLGFEGEQVGISECLPEYFDFWEAWGRE